MNRSLFVRTFVSSVSVAALAFLAGCAGSKLSVPENAKVDIFQTEKMILRGTADASQDSPSCKSNNAQAKHYVEVPDGFAGHFLLRPQGTDPAPKMAVLHVTQLETGRTWCVESNVDGIRAAIPGDFQMGTYAVSVTEPRSAQPHKYELVVEKL
jgi:hypothetical protein